MDLSALINEAAQNKEWVLLAVSAVALIVPIVLKAIGKQVPLLDTILDVAIKIAVSLRKPKAVEAPKDGETKAEGVAGVVKIEDEKK